MFLANYILAKNFEQDWVQTAHYFGRNSKLFWTPIVLLVWKYSCCQSLRKGLFDWTDNSLGNRISCTTSSLKLWGDHVFLWFKQPPMGRYAILLESAGSMFLKDKKQSFGENFLEYSASVFEVILWPWNFRLMVIYQILGSQKSPPAFLKSIYVRILCSKTID